MTQDATTARVIVRRKKENNEKNFGLSSDSQVAEKEKNDPDFPKSFPLTDTGRARGFWLDEIIEWQRKRDALKGVPLPPLPTRKRKR